MTLLTQKNHYDYDLNDEFDQIYKWYNVDPYCQSGSVTGSTTLTASDAGLILGDTSSAAVTTTLPTAVGNAGLTFHFKLDTGGNEWIIDGAGSETIDGDANFKLWQEGDCFSIRSNGTEWKVLHEYTKISNTISKTTSYTLKISDTGYIDVDLDSVSADVVLTPPSAVGRKGLKYIVRVVNWKNPTGAGFCMEFNPNGSETVNGLTYWRQYQTGQSVEYRSDGSNWVIYRGEEGDLARGQFYVASDQTISAGSWTTANITGTDYNSGLYLSSNNVYVRKPGLYAIEFQTYWSGTGSFQRQQLTINNPRALSVTYLFDYKSTVTQGTTTGTVVELKRNGYIVPTVYSGSSSDTLRMTYTTLRVAQIKQTQEADW